MMSKQAGRPSDSKLSIKRRPTASPLEYLVNILNILQSPQLRDIAKSYDGKHGQDFSTRIDAWYRKITDWSIQWSVDKPRLFQEMWTAQAQLYITDRLKDLSQDCSFILNQGSKPWLLRAISFFRSNHDQVLLRLRSIQPQIEFLGTAARALLKRNNPEVRHVPTKEVIDSRFHLWDHYKDLHKFCIDRKAPRATFLALRSVSFIGNSASKIDATSGTGCSMVASTIWEMGPPFPTFQTKVTSTKLFVETDGNCIASTSEIGKFETETFDPNHHLINYSTSFSEVIKNHREEILSRRLRFAGAGFELALDLAKAGMSLLNTPWFTTLCSCHLRRTLSKRDKLGTAIEAYLPPKSHAPSTSSPHWCDHIPQSSLPLRRLGMVLAEIAIGMPIYFGAEPPAQRSHSRDRIGSRLYKLALGHVGHPKPYCHFKDADAIQLLREGDIGWADRPKYLDELRERVEASTNSTHYWGAVRFCLDSSLVTREINCHTLEEYYRRVIIP